MYHGKTLKDTIYCITTRSSKDNIISGESTQRAEGRLGVFIGLHFLAFRQYFFEFRPSINQLIKLLFQAARPIKIYTRTKRTQPERHAYTSYTPTPTRPIQTTSLQIDS